MFIVLHQRYFQLTYRRVETYKAHLCIWFRAAVVVGEKVESTASILVVIVDRDGDGVRSERKTTAAFQMSYCSRMDTV